MTRAPKFCGCLLAQPALARFLATILPMASALMWGQEMVPPYGPAFLQDEVSVVRLTLDPDDLAFILHPDNVYSNEEFPGMFVFQSSLGVDTMTNVGIRLRGNTSRTAGKKSFKVSFNTFATGQQWHGLDKLNLNGEHNDPSILRSRMAWEFMRNQGLVAPRVSHVRLYINDEYKGLYINVEHVDEEFLKARFQYDHGNLWKCTYPANLDNLGTNPEAYKFTPPWNSEQRTYELKTNLTQDDYSAIAALCHTLGTASQDDLECALEAVFDVDGFLRLAAAEILLGHWDNYIGNQNNYYLYQRPQDGRLMMISYDLDNTQGIEWGGNWSTQSVYDWNQWGARPLYDRLMDIEQYRTRLGWYIQDMVEHGFDGSSWLQRANQLKDMCEEAALEDSYRTLDYGFDDAAYLNSLISAWGGHVTQGLASYVNTRAPSAFSQTADAQFPRDVQAWAMTPVVDHMLRVNADVAGMPLIVNLHWSADGAPFQITPMLNDGTQGDGAPDDHRWGLSMDLSNVDQVAWYVSATYSDGTQPTSPCVPQHVWISWSPDVPFLLNEVMALNNSFLFDEAGGAADWLEVFHQGNAPASVQGLFLTNRLSEPSRYPFPSFTVEPGDHRLIWLDNDPEEGPLHAPFNVDADSDDLTLSVWDDFGWRCVDHLAWSDASAVVNTSYGRTTDGAESWMTFVPNTSTPPTPNAPNAGTSTSGCAADLDGDGLVGVADVLIVLGAFGCTGTCPGDLDTNGVVGISDILAVLSGFGQLC